MDTGSQHRMVIVQQHEDGSQEWLCPVCGRRFIMQWPPNYKRTVLEPGDEDAVHTGATGGAMMSQGDLSENKLIEPESVAEDFDPESLSDPYLAPFERFLQDINF